MCSFSKRLNMFVIESFDRAAEVLVYGQAVYVRHPFPRIAQVHLWCLVSERSACVQD